MAETGAAHHALYSPEPVPDGSREIGGLDARSLATSPAFATAMLAAGSSHAACSPPHACRSVSGTRRKSTHAGLRGGAAAGSASGSGLRCDGVALKRRCRAASLPWDLALPVRLVDLCLSARSPTVRACDLWARGRAVCVRVRRCGV